MSCAMPRKATRSIAYLGQTYRVSAMLSSANCGPLWGMGEASKEYDIGMRALSLCRVRI